MPTIRNVTPNSVLYFRGDISHPYVYLIKSGSLEKRDHDIFINSFDQNTILSTGDVFGFVSAILGMPQEETVISLTNSQVISFRVDEFDDFLIKNPNIGIKFLMNMSYKLRLLSEKEKDLSNVKNSRVSNPDSPEQLMLDIALSFIAQDAYIAAKQVVMAIINSYPQADCIEEVNSILNNINIELKNLGTDSYILRKDEKTSTLHLSDGDVVFAEGQLGNTFYVVKSGAIKICKLTDISHLTTIAVLRPGAIFGEMAILENSPRSATAISEGKSEIIEFNKDNFKNMFLMNPKMILELLRIFSRRLWDTKNRIITLSTTSEQGKILGMLNLLVDDLLRSLNKNHLFNPDNPIPTKTTPQLLATLTNLPEEIVQRSISTLEAGGIVSMSLDNNIIVHSYKALKKELGRFRF